MSPFQPARPSVRQLEYLVALGEHLHFGRAAEACHASQPTLSEQISGLEQQLGVQLFERDRRGVRATPAGRALLPLARRTLEAVDRIVDAARGLSDELDGDLNLGVIPTIAPYMLPRIVGPLSRSRPRLGLNLREDSTERLLKALADGRLDLLLLSLDADLGKVEREQLFHEPFLLAAPVGHALAREEMVDATALEEANLLLLEDGH